jgi:hypothetical protein
MTNRTQSRGYGLGVAAALTITLDATSASPVKRADIMIACARGRVDVRYASATDTEIDGTSIARFSDSPSAAETFALGESRSGGVAGLGRDQSAMRHEAILDIIGDGTFPSDGRDLNESERHQLRDAMIFEAHCREGRDIFVTDDEKGFISHGRRKKLEALGNTRIMRTDEFCSWVVNWDG